MTTDGEQTGIRTHPTKTARDLEQLDDDVDLSFRRDQLVRRPAPDGRQGGLQPKDRFTSVTKGLVGQMV